MTSRFKDRRDAGRQLARRLRVYAGRHELLVLGLPRGGVPVAFEVAQALASPLDVFTVRKLGMPGQEELAMGAIASGGVRVLNEGVLWALHVPDEVLDAVTASEQRELERREREYRGDRPAPELRGRTVILVDDGLATGATMRAAVAALRRQQPFHIVVAVPVASVDAVDELRNEVDSLISLRSPEAFWSVGEWYRDFAPTTDREVCALLAEASTWDHHTARTA
jgi:putative phosphoribosyl transferase